MWVLGNTCRDTCCLSVQQRVFYTSWGPWPGLYLAWVPNDGNTNAHRLVLTLYVYWAEENGDFSGKDPTELFGTKPGFEATA